MSRLFPNKYSGNNKRAENDQYFTPSQPVWAFCLELEQHLFRPFLPKNVLDPCAGTGVWGQTWKSLYGTHRLYGMDIDESYKQVPKFWQEAIQSGLIPKVLSMNNLEPKALLGLSTCMNGKDFDYYIAVASDKDIVDDMSEYTVPKCTWAVFESIGAMPNAIQDLQKRIITEWLPTSGYEYADAPDIEVYLEGDQFAADYKCEVWLPIRKK